MQRPPTGPQDPISKSYYWHRFFSHQPDLNFDNPQVLEALWEIMRFWLDMGIDGFRFDAVPYLVGAGTICTRHMQSSATFANVWIWLIPERCF